MCSVDTFGKFLSAVTAGYHKHPYHNSVHATDVMVTANCYLQNSGVMSMPNCDKRSWSMSGYALMIASLVHDLGHPARMNPFMIQTKQALTLPYKGVAGVLEAMHADMFTKLLEKHDIFESVDKNNKVEMREMVVQLVLATDLSKQAEIMGWWNSKRSDDSSATIPGWSIDVAGDANDRLMFMKMIIKAADVSNPAKPLPVYLSWTTRILEEFYLQGDEEKSLGIAVTSMPQCDRQKPGVSGGQKGFISFMVKPTFDALVDYSNAVLQSQNSSSEGLRSTLRNLSDNLEFWKLVMSVC
jgi:hypothetical protein